METLQNRMLSWIREIVSFGIRRPGYPEDLRTESYLEEKFREFGLERVAKEPVPVNYWRPSRTSLSLDGSDFPCAAIPYTAWTPNGGLSAEAVYVGEGSAEEFDRADVSGKVVVFEARFGDLPAGLLKRNALVVQDEGNTIPDGVLHVANWLITNFGAYYEAQLRGAAAVVGLLIDSPVDGCSYYVPYDGYLKDLPAVWVGRELAGSVREAAKEAKSARLLSSGESRAGDSHNVVGWVPGKTAETILLTSHHDAPFASAVEDASGLAVLMALASHFGKRSRTLERNLLFVAASGHFHGGVGNRVFVENHREDWLADTVAALGMEHIAEEVESDGAGGYRTTGLPELRAVFSVQNAPLVALLDEGLKRWGLDRTLVVPPYLFGPEPPCDSAPFFTAGIPSACLISGPLYLFDESDTIDRVRAQDLAPAARFFQGLVEGIDKTPRTALEAGLERRRGDPDPDPPAWFLPPEEHLSRLRASRPSR
jgi:hypothetical protein